MPERSKWGRLVVAAGMLIAAAGCTLQPAARGPRGRGLNAKIQVVNVTIDQGVCVVDVDPAEIVYRASGNKKGEVLWGFFIPEDEVAEIEAKAAAEQSSDRLIAGKKLAMTKLAYKVDDGRPVVASGRVRAEPPDLGGEYPYPVWRYSIQVWSDATRKNRLCHTDPGVCVRGGSGGCEI